MLTIIYGLLMSASHAQFEPPIKGNQIQNFHQSCVIAQRAIEGHPPSDAQSGFDTGLCWGSLLGFAEATVADQFLAHKHAKSSNLSICVPGGTHAAALIRAFNSWMERKGSSMDKYHTDFVIYQFFADTYPCK